MNNDLLSAFGTLYDSASYPVILCSNELNIIKANRFAETNCKQLINENSLLKSIVSPSIYMTVVKLRESDFFDAVIKLPDGTLYTALMSKPNIYQNYVIITLRPYKNSGNLPAYKPQANNQNAKLVCERYKKLFPGIFGYVFSLCEPSRKNDKEKIGKASINLMNILHESLRTLINISTYNDFNASNAVSDDRCLNINRFLNNLFQEISQYFESMNVRFEFSIPVADIISYIDPRLLALMIDNVVSNALVFHTPKSKIKAKLVEKDSSYLISVQSKGELLPRAKTSHVFDPYCSYKSNSKSGGIGLGLTITKHIAENIYNGSCKFSSTAKYGNVLLLQLPIVNTNAQPHMVNEESLCTYDAGYPSHTEYLRHLIELFCN